MRLSQGHLIGNSSQPFPHALPARRRLQADRRAGWQRARVTISPNQMARWSSTGAGVAVGAHADERVYTSVSEICDTEGGSRAM
jgi:hypothetical protein